MKTPVLLIAALLLIVVVTLVYTSPASDKANINFESVKQLHPDSRDPVVIAAGDISCASGESTNDECNQDLTARLVEAVNPDAVLTLGDLQYPTGEYKNFTSYFDKTWGRFKNKIRPAVGNHEYSDPGAKGYFKYFETAAGSPEQGYYSFNLGPNWHLISINSNCPEAGGCEENSPQYNWLKHDLEASSAPCTLVYWHHPRFSSGLHGNNRFMEDIFSLIYKHNVELVLSGHDHDYERFAKTNPSGQKDDNGIRSFVVGTGGRNLYRFLSKPEISEVRQNKEFGVLKLVLHENSYTWEFQSIKQDGFKDSGEDFCHRINPNS